MTSVNVATPLTATSARDPQVLRYAGFGSASRHRGRKSREIRVIGQGTELLSLLLGLDDLFKRSACAKKHFRLPLSFVDFSVAMSYSLVHCCL
jgi:hypothetical protein